MTTSIDRGSVLPLLTNRWLDVNTIPTDYQEKTLVPAFTGLVIGKGSAKGLVAQPAKTRDASQASLGPAASQDLYVANGISQAVEAQNQEAANVRYLIQAREGDHYDLHFHLSKDNPLLIDRIQIQVEAGHTAKVLLEVKSDDDFAAYRNGELLLDLGEDARLDLVLLSRLNDRTIANFSVNAQLSDGAELKLAHLDLGAARSNYHFDASLKGIESDIDHQTAYLTQGEEKLDLFYHIRFVAPFSKGNISVNGALFDQSTKSFRGTLNFLEGCHGAVGDEEEMAMLMNDQVHSKAVPVLLCHEDAVEGNHASSAGRLDEDLIFYLMSRGFSRRDAEGVIIESRMTPMLEMVEDRDLRQELLDQIHERIVKR